MPIIERSGFPADSDDLVPLGSIIADLRAGSKKHVLQELARRAAELGELPERAVFDVLIERERLGSTGIGRGIAIPHGKLPELDHVMVLFARLEQPVDFDAIDEKPVDLVCMLLAPEGAGADHLKCLAKVSRVLRDTDLCERLRHADSVSALHLLLNRTAASHAA